VARPHHQLEVWKDAIALVEAVYQHTSSFPVDERFGLTSVKPRNWMNTSNASSRASTP